MIKKLYTWLTFTRAHKREPQYAAREIWLYTQIDPKTRRVIERPVLIYRKADNGVFWGLLLSSIAYNGKKMYVPRLRKGKKVSALSQMRTLKTERLIRRLGVAGEKEFSALNASIVRLLVDVQPERIVRTAPVRERRIVRTDYRRTLSPFAPVYVLQTR